MTRSMSSWILPRIRSSATATSDAERNVYAFNLALTRMRLGEWRAALESLQNLPELPKGIGTGRGAALFFRARCHEELGEVDRAVQLYKEASLAGERAGVQELSDAARALADEIEEGDDCDDMITDQLANALMRVRGAVLALGLPPKEEPHADRP